MSQQAPHTDRRLARLGATFVALLCLGLLGASSAFAAFEQVGNFAGTPGVLKNPEKVLFGKEENWPEEVQLGAVSGMAVNYTGAGGVPAGTIYAAAGELVGGNGEPSVVRFNPDGSFSERWTFAGGPSPDQRCGPEGAPAEPVCKRQAGNSTHNYDVDVDQSTGNVYMFDAVTGTVGANMIHVYTPDGSELLAEFGENSPDEDIAESPGKIHIKPYPESVGGIAVNDAGDVYAYDRDSSSYHRLMKFEPQSPGDYEHYVYAGQDHDLSTGLPGTFEPTHPVADALGDLYVFSGESTIAKLDPSQPGAPPLCEFTFAKRGIQALTVDPKSGEAFFYTYKDKSHIHRLEPCKEGKFVEGGPISFSPSRAEGTIGGLAFDPLRQFAPGRPAGVLYLGAAGAEGGQTKEEGGETFRESALGYIFSRPVEEVPPTVEAETFTHVTSTTADLAAQVNPNSSATNYVFQYETEAQYEENEPSEPFAGAMESPLGGAFAGDGNQAVTVTGPLVGLQPETAYRFRAVATSHCSVGDTEKVCEAPGETLGFRTFPSEAAGLPDHRAYELVSPPDKQGGEVMPAEPRINSCGINHNTPIPCKPGISYPRFPMQSAPGGDTVVYEGSPFDSEVSGLQANQYIAHRDPSSGWHTANLTPTHLGLGDAQGYKAFDAELTKGVIRQHSPAFAEYENIYSQPTDNPLALTPLLGEAQAFHRSANQFSLEYRGASADFSRIFFSANDALTEATAFAPAAVDGGSNKFNLYEWHEGQLSLVNVLPGEATQPGASFAPTSAHAISSNGARAFFSDESGQVYVRENGEYTREITNEGFADPGKFLTAAVDGSKVLLANGHLHLLDEEGEPTIDLTQGKGGFQGVVGETEDLSHIYFVDTEVLDETPNQEGAEAEAGKDNLYAWSEGGGTRFVAQLVAGDNPLVGTGDWKTPSLRTAEASPSGRFLAFVSSARLTGYDNTGFCGLDPKDLTTPAPAPCQEIFLYDSATGKLTCPSCNPSGERPLASSYLRLTLEGSRGSAVQPHYLSNQGRLLFDSQDSLLPADVNNGVEDVYEWEPKGVGSCESEFAEGGCVSLVSAGTGTVDSNFLAMDESGANVFFTTRDQLKLKDKDDLIDLYDARIDGGVGSETEVARTECQGEACQAQTSAPNDPTPGSSTFQGAGNVKEEAKAKKHSKKHKKKRHAKKHSNKRAAKHNRGGAK